MKDYTAAANEVREENARTVERLAKKRSRTATHNLILQVSLAAAVAAVIYTVGYHAVPAPSRDCGLRRQHHMDTAVAVC